MAVLRSFAEIDEQLRDGVVRADGILQGIEDSFHLRLILTSITMPAFSRTILAEYRARVSLDMAATACGVERYRLVHGALPTTLDALVPTFLEAVPADPFRDDGAPVSYRVNEDGGYVLYSWAQNRKDDGGIPQDREKKKGSDWNNGDWIFGVAPLSFRNGPQFTDVPPQAEEEEEEENRPAPAAAGRRSLRR